MALHTNCSTTRRSLLRALGAVSTGVVVATGGCLSDDQTDPTSVYNAVAAADDDGHLFGGQSRDRPVVVRTGPDGSERWRHRFTGDRGRVTDLLAHDDGWLAVGGRAQPERTTDEEDGPSFTVWAAALGDDGTVRWTRQYVERDGAQGSARAVVPDGDGAVVAARVTHSDFEDSPLFPGERAWLLRVGPGGDPRADRTLAADDAMALDRVGSDGLVVGGRNGEAPPVPGYPVAWVGAYDLGAPDSMAIPDPAWTASPRVSAVAALTAADGVVTGAAPTEVPSGSTPEGDPADPVPGGVFTLGPDGDFGWRSRFSSERVRTPRRALSTGNGVLFVGEVSTWDAKAGETGATHAYTDAYGPEGTRLWQRRYRGDHQELAFDAAPAGDGWVLAGGTSRDGTVTAWRATIDQRGVLGSITTDPPASQS